MVIVRSKTIEELQSECEAALNRLSTIELPPEWTALRHFIPPQGMSVRVSLRRADTHRQIKRSAGASNWNPANCEAVVYFEPNEQLEENSDVSRTQEDATGDPFADLVKSLDSAQREPRFREFVGIKSFRDKYLVERGFAWAADPASRHSVLASAIKRGLVLRSSVPNPKDPSFPTTSIRINRDHPEVQGILAASAAERSLFKPIVIPGVELSSTVLSERR